jgi:hypothetical protein
LLGAGISPFIGIGLASVPVRFRPPLPRCLPPQTNNDPKAGMLTNNMVDSDMSPRTCWCSTVLNAQKPVCGGRYSQGGLPGCMRPDCRPCRHVHLWASWVLWCARVTQYDRENANTAVGISPETFFLLLQKSVRGFSAPQCHHTAILPPAVAPLVNLLHMPEHLPMSPPRARHHQKSPWTTDSGPLCS